MVTFVIILFISLYLGQKFFPAPKTPAEPLRRSVTIKEIEHYIGNKKEVNGRSGAGNEYWDTAEPSFTERAKILQWIVEHLECYPDSDLAKDYPHLSNLAQANIAYRKLDTDLLSGKIDQAHYDEELLKIAELVDISDDFG